MTCEFCKFNETPPPTLLVEWPDAWAIVPKNPVVEGHTLVIPKAHVRDAYMDPLITGATFARAAQFARDYGPYDFNLIANCGMSASQTVFHLHVHLIPRSENDGLTLPWTHQEKIE